MIFLISLLLKVIWETVRKERRWALIISIFLFFNNNISISIIMCMECLAMAVWLL